MDKKRAIREIKMRYLTEYKLMTSHHDKIAFFDALIKTADSGNLEAYANCFKGLLKWVNKDYKEADVGGARKEPNMAAVARSQ